MNNSNSIRISIVVITYKQENLIGRTLDSILSQKDDGLFEIIVSDDCSPDGTSQVINTYIEKYPGLVKYHRNITNLGIYGNLEEGISKLKDTDLVYLCAGDDSFCPGFFKETISFIEEHKINVKEELFCIYSDWKSIDNQGNEVVYSNNLIEKGFDALSLKIRGLIFNRSVGISFKAIKKFNPVPKDKGISVAEGAFDIQFQLNVEKNYYFPFIGSIYFRGIGISTTMNNDKEKRSYIQSLRNDLKIPNIKKKDKYYLHYQLYRTNYSITPKFNYFFLTWLYFSLGFDFRLGFNIIIIFRDIVRMVIKRR